MEKKIFIGTSEFTFDESNGEYAGKLTVWGRETDVAFEIKNTEESDMEKIVTEKINWIENNKDKITSAFMEESDDCVDVINDMIEDGEFEADGPITAADVINALFVNNVFIWVNGLNTEFMLDLDAEPDYFYGHLACIEISSGYKVEFGGLNG